MSNHLKSHIQLHVVVLIFGFTAILGKLISLPAIQLVWYRTLIATVSIFLIILWKKQAAAMNIGRVNQLKFIGVGLIVAAHWLCFFHAIKISNVSVTLGCLASNTLFTSLMEPLSQKKRISLFDVIIGLIIIAGIYVIFQFETRFKLGIMVALAAAFLSGVFTVINKKYTNTYNFNVISFYEMLGALLGMSIFNLLSGNFNVAFFTSLNSMDWFWLILLGTVCSAYAFGATIDVMKVLSAFYVILAINLEPVYGIILAFLIFGQSEMMTTGFYIGTAVILITVFAYPILKRKLQRVVG